MFAKVENGVTKIVPHLSPENNYAILAAEIFHFFEQDRLLLFARVEIGVTYVRPSTYINIPGM